MRLRPDQERKAGRSRSGDVLRPESYEETKPFDVAKDLTEKDKQDFLHHIKGYTSGSRMPLYEVVAKAGGQFTALFPEAKADLVLSEQDFKGMLVAMNKRRENSSNQGRFFVEIAVPLKFLFPERVNELQIDDEVLNIMRTAVEWEKGRMLHVKMPGIRPPIEHLLSVLYGAKALFPDKTKELGLEDPELLQWAIDAIQGKAIWSAVDRFYFKIVFPQLADDMIEDEDFWNKHKEWFQSARKFTLWPQFLQTAAAMKLLADGAQLDQYGFLQVPKRGRLSTAPQLPERLVA